MSLSKEELRKEVGNELCEALRFTGRAANLLRHVDEKYYTKKTAGTLWEAFKTAEALERIISSTTEYINNLLSK